MDLSDTQRRALLAMCCEVARADGSVDTGEIEQLLELLGRLSHHSVGFSELQQWVEQGPPHFDVKLPDSVVKEFVKEAVALARADGKVDRVEIAAIKHMVERYFDLSDVA